MTAQASDRRLAFINESIRIDMEIIANTSKMLQTSNLSTSYIEYFNHVIEFNRKDIKSLLELKKLWKL